MTVGTDFSSGVVAPTGRDEHLRHSGRSAEFHVAGVVMPVVSPSRVYVCEITPYDGTHLGHAATFVWADAAEPVLRSVAVHTVSGNVTDSDDVLTAAADGHGRPALRRLRRLPGFPVRAVHGGVAEIMGTISYPKAA